MKPRPGRCPSELASATAARPSVQHAWQRPGLGPPEPLLRASGEAPAGHHLASDTPSSRVSAPLGTRTARAPHVIRAVTGAAEAPDGGTAERPRRLGHPGVQAWGFDLSPADRPSLLCQSRQRHPGTRLVVMRTGCKVTQNVLPPGPTNPTAERERDGPPTVLGRNQRPKIKHVRYTIRQRKELQIAQEGGFALQTNFLIRSGSVAVLAGVHPPRSHIPLTVPLKRGSAAKTPRAGDGPSLPGLLRPWRRPHGLGGLRLIRVPRAPGHRGPCHSQLGALRHATVGAGLVAEAWREATARLGVNLKLVKLQGACCPVSSRP